MSEVQSRPVNHRGRGSSRGSTRGGSRGYAFSSRGGLRGGRGGRAGLTANGNKADGVSLLPIEDVTEAGLLKKKHGKKLEIVREFFPEWTDEDAVMALEETDGDLESTILRITDGTITQWGEVSKNKKDRLKSKTKDVNASSALTDLTNHARNTRGGRGGFESSRGGRGRASRGGRGASVATHTNEALVNEIWFPTDNSRVNEEWIGTTVDDSNARETPKLETSDNLMADSNPVGEESVEASLAATRAPEIEASAVSSSIIPEGTKKSWASILKPVPAPSPEPKKKAPVPVERHAEETKPIKSSDTVALEPAHIEEETSSEPVAMETTPVAAPVYEPEVSITPSKDELTETNLEKVLDASEPPPTATAASTAASSWDPRNGNDSAPYSSTQQQPSRTPVSGYATTAQKATGVAGRSASFQRKVLNQEEAVRMPGNREVDRTAVQFGAFDLNGSGDDDIDGDREEPETRGQPPLHSPVAPRASLPPAPQAQVPVPESQNSPLAHGRLPVAQPTGEYNKVGIQNVPQQSSYGPYGQFGQAGAQQEQPNQKYEAFAQQAPVSQSPFDAHSSQPAQTQAPAQQPQSAFTSPPGDYSPYYASEQHRNNFQNYYGTPYGQQSGGLSHQDGAAGLQQRTANGYSGAQNEPAAAYPQSSAQQSQSRFATAGEPQASGHSTPNPVTQAQQQQPGHVAPVQSQHQPQGQAGGYPYNHPYFSSPYYANYMNQYQQGYGQGGYAGPYGAKGSVYNQPHAGYGMSPQTPYDHASSPAAVGNFGQNSLHGRDNAAGGLGEYGRVGSGQPSAPQTLGGSGAFGIHDTFARNTYQGQGQNQHYGQQPSQPSVPDELKPFGDSKAASGPSPSISQVNRPTSAANNGLGQSALPPPQASQQGYGGYPSHLQQQHALHGSQSSSQYGATAHQAAVGQGHQAAGYSQYPGFGGSYYGGNSQQRGGWGGNYGH